MLCKVQILDRTIKNRVGVHLDLLDSIIIMYVTYLYACYKVFTCNFILNSRQQILKRDFKIRKQDISAISQMCRLFVVLIYIEIPTVQDKDCNFNSDLELSSSSDPRLVKCYCKGKQIYSNLSLNKHGIFYSHFIQFLPEYVTLAFV